VSSASFFCFFFDVHFAVRFAEAFGRQGQRFQRFRRTFARRPEKSETSMLKARVRSTAVTRFLCRVFCVATSTFDQSEHQEKKLSFILVHNLILLRICCSTHDKERYYFANHFISWGAAVAQRLSGENEKIN
jgi:hypothetical protein